LIRLAWHDAGTYDHATKTGGARGSMRFAPESGHGANAGCVTLSLPDLSYGDPNMAFAITLPYPPITPFNYSR
jgi:hypothetical protein